MDGIILLILNILLWVLLIFSSWRKEQAFGAFAFYLCILAFQHSISIPGIVHSSTPALWHLLYFFNLCEKLTIQLAQLATSYVNFDRLHVWYRIQEMYFILQHAFSCYNIIGNMPIYYATVASHCSCLHSVVVRKTSISTIYL